MSITLILSFLFYIGSVIGWCIELFYRRIVSKEKKWINPGFLVGPWLPIYGFGLCNLYLIAVQESHIPTENYILRKIILFALMALMMTAIEYIAGIIFIRNMKVKLWDYSEMWGNIQGIICPLYSFFWAILGAAYYFAVHPHILDALNWLSENLAFSFFIGMFYGFFIIDFVYSAQLLIKIKNYANDHKIVIKLEELKLSILQNAEHTKNSFKFIFALSYDAKINEHLQKYHETRKKLENDIRSIIKR